MIIINLNSTKKEQFIDITKEVNSIIAKSQIMTGICVIFVPHTTAAITINENADPDVCRDILVGLKDIVPESSEYRHSEGNSAAHLKSSLFGCSKKLIIEKGKLVLGTWQGIYFCEFDGPRERKVYVKLLAE